MRSKKLTQIIGLSFLFLGSFYAFSFWHYQRNDEQLQPTNGAGQSTISKEYFAGKTIEWIVPFKEGGGGDTWVRFNAPFLSKYLPGNPNVVVSNLPGGGSIKGANLFAERAKANGLLLLGTSGSTQMPYLLDDPRVRYDYADFRPVMAFPNGGVVYVSPDLGIKDATEVAKLKDFSLIYASQGPTSLDIVPNISFELLGLDVKTIFGFRGRGAGRLAFERGEVKIDYQTSSGYLKNVVPLVQSGDAVPLWSWGMINDEGELARDPSFPDLPHFGEVYEIMHGRKAEGLAYEAWFATMAAGFGGMKLMLVPKETPDEIIALYHEAFQKMKLDPEYIARKNKAIGYYEQMTGEKADKIFKLATQINEEKKNWCKEFLRNKYGLNI